MPDISDSFSQIPVWKTNSVITYRNRWNHLLARLELKRSGHHISPGLYALGVASPESPVFVTANYTPSFDELRSALSGIKGVVFDIII